MMKPTLSSSSSSSNSSKSFVTKYAHIISISSSIIAIVIAIVALGLVETTPNNSAQVDQLSTSVVQLQIATSQLQLNASQLQSSTSQLQSTATQLQSSTSQLQTVTQVSATFAGTNITNYIANTPYLLIFPQYPPSFGANPYDSDGVRFYNMKTGNLDWQFNFNYGCGAGGTGFVGYKSGSIMYGANNGGATNGCLNNHINNLRDPSVFIWNNRVFISWTWLPFSDMSGNVRFLITELNPIKQTLDYYSLVYVSMTPSVGGSTAKAWRPKFYIDHGGQPVVTVGLQSTASDIATGVMDTLLQNVIYWNLQTSTSGLGAGYLSSPTKDLNFTNAPHPNYIDIEPIRYYNGTLAGFAGKDQRYGARLVLFDTNYNFLRRWDEINYATNIYQGCNATDMGLEGASLLPWSDNSGFLLAIQLLPLEGGANCTALKSQISGGNFQLIVTANVTLDFKTISAPFSVFQPSIAYPVVNSTYNGMGQLAYLPNLSDFLTQKANNYIVSPVLGW